MPLGATVDDEGVNFSLFSEDATHVELLLFDEHDDLRPVATIPLDPETNRSFHFWHVYVRHLSAGYHYAYRVAGSAQPGLRFDHEKVLLDPYAKGNTNTLWKPVDACVPGDNLASSMRSTMGTSPSRTDPATTASTRSPTSCSSRRSAYCSSCPVSTRC